VWAGLVIGAPLGGAIAASLGITAPFWFAFAGSGVLVVLLWRQFGYIAHSEPVP
jgi:predicted MFS family arabinose efflux permease